MGIGIGDFHALHAKAHEHDFCHQPTEGERPHWQFKPGQSGNPAGRPKGSKNKATAFNQGLFDEKAAQIVVKGLEAALGGNMSLLRAAFLRALPVPKGRPVEIELPEGASPEDMEAALAAAQRAMLQGEISPEEAEKVVAVVKGRQESQLLALALKERALRIQLLERRLAGERLPATEEEAEEAEFAEEQERLENAVAHLSPEAVDALPFDRKPYRRWTLADRRAAAEVRDEIIRRHFDVGRKPDTVVELQDQSAANDGRHSPGTAPTQPSPACGGGQGRGESPANDGFRPAQPAA